MKIITQIARDYIYIGECPPNERCAQVGDIDFTQRNKLECKQYIEALRKMFGNEPSGCELKTKLENGCLTVICAYSTDKGMEYAFKCEGDGPLTWEEAGMVAPEYEQQPTELVKWGGPVPEKDDFDYPITDEFYDGRTIGGSWAIMSPPSWVNYGCGVIGVGNAQHYKKNDIGEFIKVQ